MAGDEAAIGALALFERVPEGYSKMVYRGRTYGVTRRVFAGGRSQKLQARELGGSDAISANLYVTGAGEVLRPCEMPGAKVGAFLAGAEELP